jgi:hypothetical protein
MTRLEPLDILLTRLHAAGQTDYEITSNLIMQGYPITQGDIAAARKRLRLPKNTRTASNPVGRPPHPANDDRGPKPKEKADPRKVAAQTLGKRLSERADYFVLDGVPTRFTDVMREANRVLAAAGTDMILHNPAWHP